MKLSYCDLYFCDKAILVEGASERLLLPDMINKCEKNGYFKGQIHLTSQYFSILEVGGAYAHHFFDFIKYLEIPTLIITDIDFVKGPHNKACTMKEAEYSSNAAINKWCRIVLDLDDMTRVKIDQILSLKEKLHTIESCHIEFQKEENDFYPRSLEDAIINCNRELFELSDEANPDFENLNIKKTHFALKLLFEDEYRDYNVPSYIREGLIWLNDQSSMREA